MYKKLFCAVHRGIAYKIYYFVYLVELIGQTFEDYDTIDSRIITTISFDKLRNQGSCKQLDPKY